MRGFMICALALAFCGANATTFKVSDLNAFNEAVKKVQPGDSIVLANQIWKDAELKFKGNGTISSRRLSISGLSSMLFFIAS